ncbi:MAG: thioesterase [Gammaproteobacteria bacterium]|nr:thioesterase [Gammaproteobacteria bacterium]|tara:strand:- start:1247 stop:1666 length:420 start_codon:yes stop_codon:yes gene_type:complete
MPRITKKELQEFFDDKFPQMDFILEEFDEKSITVKQNISELNLRPGGTISGPTMMALADFAIYAAILREVGLVELAVTTSFNINFLKKPEATRDIFAKCKLLKCGKTLAIGEVSIFSEGIEAPVAHAVGTYSIPRNLTS